MLRFDFDTSPGWWVISTARALERAMTDELRPLGITYRQCLVLASLAQNGALSQADLARDLGIEPPTLTGVLSRMEQGGWLERRPCPTDARKNLVHVLPRAQDVWDTIVATALPLRARATAGLSEDDLTTLRMLLTTVRENLSQDTVQETPR